MHGTADKQIPVGDAYLLEQAGGPNVELWIVEGADHLVYTEDGNGAGANDTAYREHSAVSESREAQKLRASTREGCPARI
jgi:fermentation-respiration switch protein FrsA (DUF1100 family)